MMTVKRALRRAITDYADKVSFGFMNTYQGKGVVSTDTDASTAIFPYAKLTSCPSSKNIHETKLLTRGELERAGCFTIAAGPTNCTINGVDYTIASVTGNGSTGDNGTGDSRWVIPRGDGSGKYDHVTAPWATCSGSAILPACAFAGGTGLYEGTYYNFSYERATPVATGPESMAQPKYQTTYMGKYYTSGGNCYGAIDAERSEIVNDGVFNRPAYVLAGTATSAYTATGTSVAIDTSKEVYVPVPWSGAPNVSTCVANSGAIYNSGVVPFLNQTGTSTSTSTSTVTDKALSITARLDRASFGGVPATGRLAPLGCALDDANSYMSTVKGIDSSNNSNQAPCWSNNIVLVVDGQSNGPGDLGGAIDCASTACASATPTAANGCNCGAINKAYALAQAGVETHVVVNAPAIWSARYPYTYAFLWNLALAGSRNSNFNNYGNGTPSFGTSEEEVYKAISNKIAAAAYPFVFTTTAPVAGATTQDPTTQILSMSNVLYDTGVDYPAWKGNVRAFYTSSSGAQLAWDAIGVAAGGHPANWMNRRIYFSDKSGNLVKVDITSSGAINNAPALYAAGLGASAPEAGRIMQWLLGKPELGNPTPLMGSVTSSTPIVVGQPASNGLNGSTTYSQNNWKRPQLLYVGGDDGMLHAFFAPPVPPPPAPPTPPPPISITLGSSTYYAGEEAFAFIPNDMLAVIAKLYAQGGQNLSADQKIDPTTKAHQNLLADKGQHIFGLAGSPKVKDMCIGTSCSSSNGSDWHTVLVMPEGPGGNKPFALDITKVVTETAFNGLSTGGSPPGSLLWSAAVSSDTNWDKSLGETTSVPAFYLNGYNSGTANNRVLFASGYPTQNRGTSGYTNQGLAVLDVDAVAGTIQGSPHVIAAGSDTCTQQRAVLADIGLARNWSSATTSQNLVGAYIVDTWGNTFQYVPGMGSPIPVLYTLTCKQPLHFSPAVVQLDKAPKVDTSSKGYIYLVQVTNSNLDPDTRAYSTSYPGSQLVVSKWDGNQSPPSPVLNYNTAYASGRIVLATDATDSTNRICLQATDVTKTAAQACGTGLELPVTARPVATPTVILRSDGLGFQVITGWYDWGARTNNCTTSANNFNYGTSYITVHEFGADGTWYQIAGVAYNNTVLTGVAFVGLGLFVDGIMGANNGAPSSVSLGESITSMQQILNNSDLPRYSRTSWSERVE
jgi:hypothetical protein